MRRLIVFLSISAFAWAILTIGMLSPLTPSEGLPETSNILLFLGGPIVLLGIATWYGKHWIIRMLGVVQIALVLWIAKWLLMDILHHPWFR